MRPFPNKKVHMEFTLTQSSALYLVHHKISERRSELFPRLRAAVRIQPSDGRGRTFRDAQLAQRFQTGNAGIIRLAGAGGG